MPYGIDKDLGGDTEKNDKWMEDCVNKVMNDDGKDKPAAIAICKTILKKSKADLAIATFILADFIKK
jgi:hypothetical protein